MKYKSYLAEFIGTFVLSMAVAISVLGGLSSPDALLTPVAAGLALGLFVYTVGAISGAHLNPAVTIALASIKKISPVDALFYIIAQLAGAGLTMLAMVYLSTEPPYVLVGDQTITLALEALGAFILIFGVSSVVHKKVDDDASGLVIGGSLFLGVLITAGVLNPAVAMALKANSVVYYVGPVIGTLIGAWIYRGLLSK